MAPAKIVELLAVDGDVLEVALVREEHDGQRHAVGEVDLGVDLVLPLDLRIAVVAARRETIRALEAEKGGRARSSTVAPRATMVLNVSGRLMS